MPELAYRGASLILNTTASVFGETSGTILKFTKSPFNFQSLCGLGQPYFVWHGSTLTALGANLWAPYICVVCSLYSLLDKEGLVEDVCSLLQLTASCMQQLYILQGCTCTTCRYKSNACLQSLHYRRISHAALFRLSALFCTLETENEASISYVCMKVLSEQMS